MKFKVEYNGSAWTLHKEHKEFVMWNGGVGVFNKKWHYISEYVSEEDALKAVEYLKQPPTILEFPDND